jgi:hypothetical protein
MSQQIWDLLYPTELSGVLVFSNGWFWRFLRRYSIVRRRITKVATKQPAEVVHVTNSFIQFIRKHNRREDDYASMVLRSSPPINHGGGGGGGDEFTPYWKKNSLRKFLLNLIINLDETPLPFEFFSGYTYDFKGVNTVAGKSERSGWDKRQATIILYIMADGSTSFKPVFIFYGKGTVAKRKHFTKPRLFWTSFGSPDPQ